MAKSSGFQREGLNPHYCDIFVADCDKCVEWLKKTNPSLRQVKKNSHSAVTALSVVPKLNSVYTPLIKGGE